MKKIFLLFFIGVLSFSLFSKQNKNSDVIVVTSQDGLNEVLNKNDAVSVKFMASWCPACNNMKGLDQKMRNQFKGKVVFVEIDSDNAKDLVEKYKVKGIPTYLFLKNKKETKRITGSIKENDYTKYINSIAKK